MKHILLSLIVLATTLLLTGCGGGGTGGGNIDPVVINKIHGLCVGPYLTGNPNNGDSVSSETVDRLLERAERISEWVSTYSSTHGAELIPPRAKALGLKVAAGCWLSSNMAANETEINALIALINQHAVDVAVVGSECLYRGDLTPAQLNGYIDRVKATGVTTTTRDTWSMLRDHPEVVAKCDVIYANMFPFWEGATLDNAILNPVSGWNGYLYNACETLKATYPGKQLVIAESGWPSAGDPRASEDGQGRYVSALAAFARAQGYDFFIFEENDEPWKTAEGAVGPHWGIYDTQLRLKSILTTDLFLAKIQITSANATTMRVTGKVTNVNRYSDYKIVVYFGLPGQPDPYQPFVPPYTQINGDGTWSFDYSYTGMNEAVRWEACLVPAYLPESDFKFQYPYYENFAIAINRYP